MNQQNQKKNQNALVITLVAVLAVAGLVFAGTMLVEGGYLQGSLKNVSVMEKASKDTMVKERVTDRSAAVKKMNDSLRTKNKQEVLNATTEIKAIAETDSEAVYVADQIEKIYTINDSDAMDILYTAAQNYTVNETSLNTEAVVINYDLSKAVVEAETVYVGEISMDEPVSIGEVWYYLPSDEIIDADFVVKYTDGTQATITAKTVEGSENVYSFINPMEKEIVYAAFVDKGYDKAIFDASKLVYAADLDGNVLFFEEAVN